MGGDQMNQAETRAGADRAQLETSPIRPEPASLDHEAGGSVALGDYLALVEQLVRGSTEDDPDEGADQSRPTRPFKLGRFTVIEEVGRGGFGIVYRALDASLRREVALKVPRPEFLVSPDVRRRFLREARAAASLEHHGIVPVLEVGPIGSMVFIASVYCPGPTLSRWLKTQTSPVSPKTGAGLMLGLALAVDHAHRRGVLHRDLKPSNILLDFDASGEPSGRITDFGLATVADEMIEESRSSHAVIGSPPYMSPEQASGRHREIGESTDVYALGVILYEVLLGQRPFVGETASETLRLVVESDPIEPRTLRPRLPRDLETIILTCLEKQASRRYASASELADDLKRFLAGEPIKARSRSWWRLAGQWVRRRPRVAVGVAAVALAATVLIASLSWSNARQRGLIARIDTEQRRADALATEAMVQRDRAERHLRGAQLELASQALDSGQVERAQNLLRDVTPLPTSGEAVAPGPAWRLLWGQATRELQPLYHHKRDVRQLALSPDGSRLYTGDEAGNTAAWDVTGSPLLLRAYPARPGMITQLAVSPDGRYLATRLHIADGNRKAIWVRDTTTDRLVLQVEVGAEDSFEQVGFDPSGSGFWAIGFSNIDKGLVIDRYELSGEPSTRPPARTRCANRPLYGTPSGRFLSIGPSKSAARDEWSIDPEDPSVVHWRINEESGPLWAPSVEDPSSVAISVPGQGVIWRSIDTGAVLAWLPVIAEQYSVPVISPNGQVLAVLEASGTVAIAERGSNEVRHVDIGITGDEKLSCPMALSHNGDRLAVCPWSVPGGSKPSMLYDTRSGRRLLVAPTQPERSSALLFSDDDHAVYIATGPTVQRWDLAGLDDPKQPEGHGDEAWSIVFEPKGRWFYTGGDDTDDLETIKRWDIETGRLIQAWRGGVGTVAALGISPDGALLVSGHLGDSETVRFWDARTGASLGHLDGEGRKVRSVVFSKDGRQFAVAGDGGLITICDTATRRAVRALNGHNGTVPSIAFSPDGATLASVSSDTSIRLWDIETGVSRLTRSTAEKLCTLAFHPNGSIVAAADEDGLIHLLDVATGTLQTRIDGEDRSIRALSFCPGGNELAAGGEAGRLYMWDSDNGQQLVGLTLNAGVIHGLAFAPDRSAIVTAADNGQVRIWRLR
jgi:WD40 repeat protein